MHYEAYIITSELLVSSCPSHINGDNMSAVHKTSRPASVLKKKKNSTCSHAVYESVAMSESFVGCVPCSVNLVDLMMKVKQRCNVLYEICDYH